MRIKSLLNQITLITVRVSMAEQNNKIAATDIKYIFSLSMKFEVSINNIYFLTHFIVSQIMQDDSC